MITIRKALAEDKELVWEIIREVISTGDTYVFAPDTSKEEMLKYWFGADKYVYVAESDKKIAGTLVIKANQPGLASHIANASYMVSPSFRGRGVGRMLGEFSLEEARSLGFDAMQFNIVVKPNTAAVNLWTSLGFQIIAEIPDAFQHKKLGLVNAYIMYRKL